MSKRVRRDIIQNEKNKKVKKLHSEGSVLLQHSVNESSPMIDLQSGFVFVIISHQSISFQKSGSLLSQFIWPLSIKEFQEKVYRQKALACVGGGARRFQQIIENGLASLHLPDLLEQTPSEHIFVWMKTQEGNRLSSFEVDEKAALVCHQAGSFHKSLSQFLIIITLFMVICSLILSIFVSFLGATRRFSVFSGTSGICEDANR
jgi:hypothetical protein